MAWRLIEFSARHPLSGIAGLFGAGRGGGGGRHVCRSARPGGVLAFPSARFAPLSGRLLRLSEDGGNGISVVCPGSLRNKRRDIAVVKPCRYREYRNAVAGIVFVVQRRQFRIMAHIQRGELIGVAGQPRQFRIVAYVQRSELIGVAEQSRQFRTAAHIQRDESIGVAGQHFQRLEIFDTFQRGQQAIAGESSVHAECPNVFHLSESDMLRVGDITLLLQYSGEPRIECGGYIRIVVGSCRYHYGTGSRFAACRSGNRCGSFGYGRHRAVIADGSDGLVIAAPRYDLI